MARVLTVFLMFCAATAQAGETKVAVEGDTVTLSCTDLNDTKDTLARVVIDHPEKSIKIVIAPMPQADDIKVSHGVPLAKAYLEALQMLAHRDNKIREQLRKKPGDIDGTLTLAENKLGIDKIPGKASLRERCYRVAWAEGLSRCKHELKNVIEVTFESK